MESTMTIGVVTASVAEVWTPVTILILHLEMFGT